MALRGRIDVTVTTPSPNLHRPASQHCRRETRAPKCPPFHASPLHSCQCPRRARLPWLFFLLYQMERGGSPAATTNGLSRWWDPAGNDQHARSCRRRAHWCRPSSPLHGWSPSPIIADHSPAFWNLAQSLLAPVPPARRPQRDGPARACHAPRVRVPRRGRSAQRPSCAACGSPVRCAAPGLPGLRAASRGSAEQ